LMMGYVLDELPAFVRKVISSSTTFSQKSSTYNNLVAMATLVSSSNFTNRNTMVKKSYVKTATILFYVSPSIDTRIKNAQTIDLMEGGKEQAQNVPNSEINRCDKDGKEGHADGSSRCYRVAKIFDSKQRLR